MCIYGDRAFFVDDRHTKSAIAQTKAVKPQLRPDVVMKVISKTQDTPATESAEWAGEISPGHASTYDLAKVRLELHA